MSHMNPILTAKKSVLSILSVLVLTMFVDLAQAQTVLNSMRIGGYAEDITFVSSGKLKNNIVILDGFELYAVRDKKNPNKPIEKLFSVKIPEFDQFPNGITYVESEKLFALNNVPHPDKLYFFDQDGVFKGTRTIQYLNSSYRPQHMEGMSYIPASSPLFPDHLLVTVLDTPSGPSRIEVVRRDGVVVAEINPNWPAPPPTDPDNPIYDTSFIGDVAFQSPNKLLVTFYNNTIWTIDLNGNVLLGPMEIAGANGFEGIVETDKRIVTVNFPQRLMFFDQNLARLPDNDRNDLIGLNLNLPSGIAWNSDTHSLLINHTTSANPFFSLRPDISTVPTSLDSATHVANLHAFPQARRMTYMPDEHRMAIVSQNNPRAILLVNNDGTVAQQIDLSPAALGQNLGGALTITYLPASQEFIVGFNGVLPAANQQTERRSLRVISRATGAIVRTIDLTATGTGGVGGLTYFKDGSGNDRLMILGSGNRVFITDLNGDSRNADGFLLGEFNSRAKLGLVNRADVTAITSGPLSGSFAMIDRNGGELVIFRLDN